MLLPEALAGRLLEYASAPTIIVHGDTVHAFNRAAKRLFAYSSPATPYPTSVEELSVTVSAIGRERPRPLHKYLQTLAHDCKDCFQDGGSWDVAGSPWEDAQTPSTAYRCFSGVTIEREKTDHARPQSVMAIMTTECIWVDGRPGYTLTFAKDPDSDRSSAAGRTHRNSSRESSVQDVFSASATTHRLDSRFSEFRDAIYYSSSSSGFILSADEKFAFPNYKGSKLVEPVEVDNVNEFFKDYDAWDATFTRRLTVNELPSVKINRDRKNFQNRRVGLIQNGRKTVLQASGQCLYSPVDQSYIGNVVWVDELGELHEVQARDKAERLKSFQTICDSLPHMVWTADASGDRDYFSARWFEFTGLTAEQSMNGNWINAVHPDDMKLLRQKMKDGQKTQDYYSVESRYKRSDGAWRWVTSRARPVRDSEGKIVRWYGTSTDIHELVEARRAAQRIEAQILAVLAHSEIKIYEILGNNDVKMLKGRFAFEQHEPDGEESVGPLGPDFLRRLRHEQTDDESPFERAVRQIQHGQRENALCEHQIGEKWFRTQLVADLNGNIDTQLEEPVANGPFGVLGCSVDLTEERKRLQLEKDNARLVTQEQAAIEQSERKSQFLAHMSHELRTPVSGILGMARFLLDSNLTVEQREYSDCILLSSQNLLGIVNDILDLTKVETGRMETENVLFCPAKVVSDLQRVWTRTIGSDRKSLRFLCSNKIPSTLRVHGDPHRITQVLTNLLSNSSKFTPSGSISLTAEIVSERETEVSMKFVVEDTGCGISKEVLHDLFKPFRQGDSSTARLFGGTGLGLAISKNLAQLMGGDVHLSSTPGRGTSALFTLRAFRPDLSKAAELVVPQTPAIPLQHSISRNSFPFPTLGSTPESDQPTLSISDRSKTRILVVEDNLINQKIAVKNVEKLGFPVTAASNGKEAVDLLKSKPAAFSAVLMDIQMPILDGYGATKELRRLGNDSQKSSDEFGIFKDLPIIALTASAISGDREKAIAAGMNSYLVKPLDPVKLEEALVKWTSGKLNESNAGG